MTKVLKSALHHWWPRSLSGLWAAEDGCVTQLAWDGTAARAPPANFGAITNAHHIKLSEINPWNTSFEEAFCAVDNEFDALAEWLLGLEVTHASPNATLQARLLPQTLTAERRMQLARCLASLIVRSPGFRNRVKVTVEYYQRRFGVEKPSVDKPLIAANIMHCYEEFTRAISHGGRFIVLVSTDQEFVFGDGFLQNFPPRADPPLNPKCAIPLLPSVTVLFARSPEYRSQSELMTLLLNSAETNRLNEIVQVYSRDHIFFRIDSPDITEAFARREFLHFEYHNDEWIENVIAAAESFNSLSA
jgi:hypothetical protein